MFIGVLQNIRIFTRLTLLGPVLIKITLSQIILPTLDLLIK